MTLPDPLPAGAPATTADDAPRAPHPVVRRARSWALAGLLGLIVLGLAWELWLAPTGSGTLAVKVLPLALCLAGLLRHRLYTFRWLSLLLWLYFLEGVVRATTESGISQVCAVLEIALCLWLFAACTVYIRWRLRNKLPGDEVGVPRDGPAA
jgi:uncharacterized membrane protein